MTSEHVRVFPDWKCSLPLLISKDYETMNVIYFMLIGLVAGWLAGRIMKGRGSGVLTNLIVGMVGALLGGFLFSLLGLSAAGLIGDLVMATVGAMVLIFLLRKLTGRGKGV